MPDGRARWGTPAERLERMTRRLPSGCWEFTGSRNVDGYGRMGVNGKNVLAHRLAYELAVGPIPDGLVMDHLCRNRACVNPDHLEPVTNRENVLRGVGRTAANAAKTHCGNGHALEGANVRIVQRGDSIHRFCRACRRQWQAQRAARLRKETA